MSARRRSDERGQAAVELVVLAPLLLAMVLAAAQLLAAGAAAELADHAAEAGAVAVLQGEDPTAAAREAVPRWSRKRMTVRVRGRRVQVRMRPRSPIPGLGDLLEVARDADAGPRSLSKKSSWPDAADPRLWIATQFLANATSIAFASARHPQPRLNHPDLRGLSRQTPRAR